jgi:hypothetical protein
MAEKGKALDEKEQSRSWKLALFFHSLAWPLSVTSAVLFSVFLMDEQICTTYFDFGFAKWRGVVVFIATYFPIVVLTIDFLVNSIMFSYKHLLQNIVAFLLFVFASFLGSIAQDRPAYPNHLAFKKVYGNNYTEPNYNNLSDPAWARWKAQDCMQKVFDWKDIGDQKFEVLNWSKNLWMTLGVGIGTLVIFHFLITAVSQIRYKIYGKSETK